MIRTQIYLTEQERDALGRLAAESGRPQSELIRDAVDHFISLSSDAHRQSVLDRTAGLWKNRDDLPDFADVRRQWDRRRQT